MFKFKSRYSLLLTFITLLWLTSPLLAADDEPYEDARNRPQVFHVSRDMDLVTIEKIQYGKPKMVIKSVYPELQSDNPENVGIDDFNDAVVNLVQEEVSAFKNQVGDFSRTTSPPAHSTSDKLYIDYDASIIKVNNGYLVSVRLSSQGFINGMAHPYQKHRVLNYDLNENRALKLSELFNINADYLNLISNDSRNTLSRRVKDQSFMMEGTTPIARNFQNWNLTPTGILLTFDRAQVAPSVNGTQTVLIPYAAFKSIVSVDSPISACVNHKRKCTSNHLLTGGFNSPD
ncbi:MAG: hypothetical protein A3E85_03955 [Gammaproteobacteria bacterium RIFCSPHIGHO2_12_FULL_45_12]|nr:MAG: hypothetical protein A3E85_03955 [Gammaproteobacteria bacterium RIFCSPHIGHO2_12_FULL_45_12]